MNPSQNSGPKFNFRVKQIVTKRMIILANLTSL